METRFAWPTSQPTDGNNNADQIAPLKQIGCDVFGVNAVTYMSGNTYLFLFQNTNIMTYKFYIN